MEYSTSLSSFISFVFLQYLNVFFFNQRRLSLGLLGLLPGKFSGHYEYHSYKKAIIFVLILYPNTSVKIFRAFLVKSIESSSAKNDIFTSLFFIFFHLSFFYLYH